MPSPRSILVVSSEFGVNDDGAYRPGGLAQFSRCVFGALATSSRITRLAGWGLLDSRQGADWMQARYLAGMRRARAVEVTGFAGSRMRMTRSFLREQRAFELVMFIYVGVGRLSVLRPFGATTLWLVGIEVRRPLNWVERLVVRRADPLLSISKFSSDEMLRHNPALPGASAVVHLCAEPDDPWIDARSDGPIGYVAAARTPAVLIVARQAANERYKGHDQLIAGWPRVLERVPAAELWIVGTGDDQARLQALAASVDVGTSVRFFGKVSHEKLLELYGSARVFAMPSSGEGFGLVFVEAMRHGMPCICSRDSAAEIVVDRQTGLVVEQNPEAVAGACADLLLDCDRSDRMGAEGRLRYKREFTFAAMTKRLLHALELDEGVD
jgi:phosphatidylinositol alpha-1,6-mannosyltransferase